MWGGSSSSSSAGAPPPYGQRKNFHPKSTKDYGDGGAYPECVHVPQQYPLDMGRQHGTKN